MELGLSEPICHWIKDCLTNGRQTVKNGPHLSLTFTLSTSFPQGMLNPLLYTLYTHDYAPIQPTNTIRTFMDDTTVAGLTN